MKKYLFCMLLAQLFIGNQLYGQRGAIRQQTANQNDTLKFDAVVVTELDSNLLKMLKWHQKVKKEKFRENDIYIIYIFPTTEGVNLPKHIIDSIYANNKFPVSITSPSYRIVIGTEDKREPGMRSKSAYIKKYYYNYHGRDVLIISDLNIQLPNSNERKSFCLLIDKYVSHRGNDTWYFYAFENIFEIILRNLK